MSHDNARPTTRSQSQLIPGLLNVPSSSNSDRRSPVRTLSAIDAEVATFFPFDTTNNGDMTTIDMDEIRRIATAAASAAAEAACAAAVSSAVSAVTAATATQAPAKKPELPAFDASNVNIWIRRVESAYTRFAITTAKDKFAFLEPKFPVSFNPKVNDFLFGPATDDNWQEFIEYLQKEYGKTKQQKAGIILDGIKRDGRRPSQLLSAVVEATRDVTVDEIRKEMILRELPPEIRRSMADKVEDLSAGDTAKLADSYYDKDGHVAHAPAGTSVSHVDDATDELPDDVNAVNRPSRRYNAPPRPQQHQQQGMARPKGPNASPRVTFSASRPQYQQQSQRQNRAQSNHRPQFAQPGRNESRPSDVCFYHDRFGDRATKCESGCRYQGNDRAARRM